MRRLGDTAASAGFPGRRLAVGLLLLELATIAFLPPWEGFDETAHYSYLQQLADTSRIPVLGASTLSRDVEDYARWAPLPYAATAPMEQNGGLTYRAFFAATRDVVARGRHEVHDPPLRPRRYAAGVEPNWQAQHPPAYYALLAPIYHATSSWSWARQLFVLRACSCLLAWLAWCLTAAAAARLRRDPETQASGAWGLIGVGLWPVLFPAWFADMARVGNDSLCALIVAAAWFESLDATRRGFGARHGWTLGGLLGLGCLTKVFLLPVAIGTLGFWVTRCVLRERGSWPRVALAIGVAATLSAPWYIYCWHQYGQAVVSATDVLVSARTGVVPEIPGGAWASLPRNLASLAASATWTPTWSLARPHEAWLTPLVVAAALAIVAWLGALRRVKPTGLAALPLWMALPLAAGLVVGLLAKAAAGVPRGVGGYYLHVAAAPLSFALGLGLAASSGSTLGRRAWIALTAYAIGFGIVVQWAQLLLYAGILYKAGADKHYQLASLPAALGLPTALSRLEDLGYPRLGAVLWLMGEALVLWGLAAFPGLVRSAAREGSEGPEGGSGPA